MPDTNLDRSSADSALSLLEADEPAPFQVLEGDPSSPYLITCDHAGNRLPKKLGDLGLPEGELRRHIAWDIGVAGLGERLAAALGAFQISQTYSRLVIDCNRPLDSETSIAEHSEHTQIPGNHRLSSAEARQRAEAIFLPYHCRIETELERRRQAGLKTFLIALHSFTPVFKGASRPWHLGILYGRDPRLARIFLELLRQDGKWVVGDNEPYRVSDATDYGVVQYGERRGIPHVELEVRQDLISDEAGQDLWAERLQQLIGEAGRRFAE